MDSPMDVIVPDLEIDLVQLPAPLCTGGALNEKMKITAARVLELPPGHNVEAEILVIRQRFGLHFPIQQS
jgi:hypothetical protein